MRDNHTTMHRAPVCPGLPLACCPQVELCPGGSTQLVTAGNLEQYISAVAQYKQVDSMAAEARALGAGLLGVLTAAVAEGLPRWLIHAELNAMVAGLTEVDVAAWQEHTRYEHCTARTPQLGWLWAAVAGWGAERRRQLLAFVTSSSALPAGGFAALRGFNGALHPFTGAARCCTWAAALPAAAPTCRPPQRCTCVCSQVPAPLHLHPPC